MPTPGYGPSGFFTPADNPEDWASGKPPTSVPVSVPIVRALGYSGFPFPIIPTILDENESWKVKED